MEKIQNNNDAVVFNAVAETTALGCARKNATFDFCDEHLESEGG